MAPDYVLVHADMEQRLIDSLVESVNEFFGPQPQESEDFGRIVNTRHVKRLIKLYEDTAGSETAGGETVIGGQWDIENRYFAPTILKNVSPDSAVMGEEIFGPILPVISVRDMAEAIEFVRSRPKPLALYTFTNDRGVEQNVLEKTTSGSVCINDVLMQLTAPGLPFGGVGESGMGAYHGRHSFDTFSHTKAVMRRAMRPDLKLRYPPYGENKLKWLRRLL